MSIMKIVDPDDIPNMLDGRRGRGSYNIVNEFLRTINPATGNPVVLVKLDHKALNKTTQSLGTGLTMYAKSHDLPIKVMQRSGSVYLMRKDLLADGTPDPEFEGRIVAPTMQPADVKDIDIAVSEVE